MKLSWLLRKEVEVYSRGAKKGQKQEGEKMEVIQNQDKGFYCPKGSEEKN